MVLAQPGLADFQGAPEVGFALLVPPDLVVQVAQVVQALGHGGIVLTELAFANGQAALQQRFGIPEATQLDIPGGQVIEDRGRVDMIGAEHLGRHLGRPFVMGDALVELTLVVQCRALLELGIQVGLGGSGLSCRRLIEPQEGAGEQDPGEKR